MELDEAVAPFVPSAQQQQPAMAYAAYAAAGYAGTSASMAAHGQTPTQSAARSNEPATSHQPAESASEDRIRNAEAKVDALNERFDRIETLLDKMITIQQQCQPLTQQQCLPMAHTPAPCR